MKINLDHVEQIAKSHIHGVTCNDVRLMPSTVLCLIKAVRASKAFGEQEAGSSWKEVEEALDVFE